MGRIERNGRVTKRGTKLSANRNVKMTVYNPYTIRIDSRDLADIINDRIDPALRRALRASVNPETGRGYLRPMSKTKVAGGFRPLEPWGRFNRPGGTFVNRLTHTDLDRAESRWVNGKRAKVTFFFPIDSVSGKGIRGPRLVNAIEAAKGYDVLGLGGRIGTNIDEAVNEYLEDVVSGDDTRT